MEIFIASFFCALGLILGLQLPALLNYFENMLKKKQTPRKILTRYRPNIVLPNAVNNSDDTHHNEN